MITRTYKALTSRPVFVLAAALAILMLAAPFVFAATSVTYPENGTDPVATFAATDQDGDPIVWSLGGDDVGQFSIDGGVLNFKSPPDYEEPNSKSIGTRADMNVYNVKVQATGGTEDVIVTVTNVDEDGSISFTGLGQFQPQVGRSLEAVLGDPDGGQTDEAWQWARSMDMQTWTDIDGATTAKRSPAAADEGYYLRASVTYTDIFGSGKTVSKVTGNAVEARTVSNTAPSFADQDETTGENAEAPNVIVVTREVAENTAASMNIGKPVSASDGDNDVLVYTLSGTVSINNVDTAATSLFSIVPTSGQLKTKAKLNFEGGSDNNPTDDEYGVMVTATDPSGAATPQPVTITLTDANEAPAFGLGAIVPKVLNVSENDDDNQIRVGPTGGGDLSETAYNADDEDTDSTDTPGEDNAILTLSGADAKYFNIDEDGTLTIQQDTNNDGVNDHMVDYEAKSSYSIAIVATSGQGDRTRRARLEVTVHVVDTEDPGSVSLTQLEPQVDRAVVAMVSDPDGGVTLTRWTWATSDAAPIGTCAAHTGDYTNVSPDVSSGAYTPKAADATKCLQATATYTDNIEGDGNDDANDGNMEMVSDVSQKPVQTSNPANSAPKFPDQDLTTVGDQSDSASRSVAENMAKENVGGPISASDGNADALLYSLSGDDAASFSVDDNGQIKTEVKLDFETKDEYMVALTATDPSGANDSIMVTVTVTDGPDPAVITGSTAIDYDENGTDPVATFSATDQDGDDIVWSLGGADAARFNIDEGVLTFKAAPNYESPNSASIGTRADRNVYNVIVQATGGTHAVAVTVTNVDEDGSVSYTGQGQVQPQVGRSLEATLSDPDMGETDEVWQWARSMDMQSWTAIEGATSQRRSPTADDEGYYLRASVTYTDVFGSGKSASKVTPNAVEERTVANAAPSFADQDDVEDVEGDEDTQGVQINRSVDENTPAATNIGKPVSASDADNDVLVYTLGDDDDEDSFSISPSTGQLKTKAALDFEADANPADDEFSVMVTATDPSGAFATETVTIELMDVNEAPKFDIDTDTAGNQAPPTTLNVIENGITLRSGTTDLSGNTYNADDEDSDETTVTYSLSGADAKYFDISATAGALTIDQDTNDDDTNDHTVNYEGKSSYSITIVAMSGAEDRTLRTKLDVTVNVVDAEDGGTVSLTAREPQVGRTVVATVSDPDGGVALRMWAWATQGGTAATETTPPSCPDAGAGTWDPITGVSTGAYTPKAADVGDCLRATATYTDNIPGDASPADTTDNDDDDSTDENMDGIDVSEVTERPVQASNPANAAPKFPDQDLTTVGDQSDEATREVAENKAKENVGGPISAGDGDGDALMYSLSGDDADSFSVDDNGQIKTKVKLDFETKDMYMVALTATDPSGAADSILVTIMVIDGDDDATVTLVGNNAPEFASDTASRSVEEGTAAGMDIGDPITATDADADDTLTYRLDEMGDMYFDIDSETGQLMTSAALDDDMMSRHTVTVTADDGNDGTDSIEVTITVTDMQFGCSGPAAADCEALLEAKPKLEGDGSTRSLNWDVNTPIADWDGVRKLSDSGRVEWLYLHGVSAKAETGRAEMKLNGTIAVELSGLTELTRLFLHRNNLTGEIPGELSELTNLVWLRLYDNGLSGGIPDLTGMDSLERLYIHENELSGGIPMTLGSLSSLTHMLLHDNDLSGGIPAMLGDMSTLVWLSLYENNLSGGIPTELGGLSSLQRLYLHKNGLTGGIPAELGNLSALTNLWLNDNMLTGGIPSELGNLSLERWRLRNNSFDADACLPAALAAVTNSDMEESGLEACASGN